MTFCICRSTTPDLTRTTSLVEEESLRESHSWSLGKSQNLSRSLSLASEKSQSLASERIGSQAPEKSPSQASEDNLSPASNKSEESASQKTPSQEVCSTSTVLASPLKGLSPAPPPLVSSPSLKSVSEEVEEAILSSLPPSQEDEGKYSSSFEHQTREDEEEEDDGRHSKVKNATAEESSTETEIESVPKDLEKETSADEIKTRYSVNIVDNITEQILQQLLAETSKDMKDSINTKSPLSRKENVAPEASQSPRRSHTRSKSVTLKPQDLMLSTFDLTSSSDDSFSPLRKVSGPLRDPEESDQDSVKQQSPEEEFIDDDFGLSAIRQEAEILRLQQLKVEEEIAKIAKEAEATAAARAIPDRPPPPYTPPTPPPPPRQQPAPPPSPLVPHSKEQVDQALDTYVDILFSAKQNYVDFDEVEFDPGLVPECRGEVTEEERRSVVQYHRMLWQLAVEKICGVYEFEKLKQNPPWMSRLPLGKMAFLAPKTLEGLRTRIRKEVGADLGLVDRVQREGLLVRWAGKKRDRVDEILVRELQEEEAVWTDYSLEEALVKQQMADALLELLLQDTVDNFTAIYSRPGEKMSLP